MLKLWLTCSVSSEYLERYFPIKDFSSHKNLWGKLAGYCPTTSYHPICNGLVEKFNDSLKQIFKRYALKNLWTGTVLFAYRDVLQHGFSPFEMNYWRIVRSLMMILKELWSSVMSDEEIS